MEYQTGMNKVGAMADEVHFLTHEFTPFRGGIGVYIEESARALATAGKAVTVWAPDYGREGGDPFPFEVRRVRMRGKQDWVCRIQLAKALREAFPKGAIPGTVVLAEPGPIRLWMYHELLNLPRPDRIVVILHGSEVCSLSRIAHRKRLFRRLLDRADAVGVVSTAVRELVLRVAPAAEGKLVRVPGAVRGAWRDLPPAARSADPPWELLQVGRLHPRKGQVMLVEAVACLPPHLQKRIRIRYVGQEGRRKYMNTLRQRIETLQVPAQLEGALTEPALRHAYETAALLVMPSQPHQASIEGLGLALLEAQHFGCPVIGTRVGGIPEALRDGETGWLVQADDAQALADAIARALEDPQTRLERGRAAARFVREHFSWEQNLLALGLV